MTDTTADVARRYIERVGAHDLDPLEDLFAADLVARIGDATFGPQEWLGALRSFLPALVRNDISDVVAAGDRAVVAYDFVTDTPAGTVRCVELLTVTDGAIRAIELVFDSARWGLVMAALAERAGAAS